MKTQNTKHKTQNSVHLRLALLTFLIASLTVENVSADVTGPTTVCPNSNEVYSAYSPIVAQQISNANYSLSITGGKFSPCNCTNISLSACKGCSVSFSVKWDNNEGVGKISATRTGAILSPTSLNVTRSAISLNIAGPTSVQVYTDYDYFVSGFYNLIWSLDSGVGAVVFSNADKSWVKIRFWSTGNKTINVSGTTIACNVNRTSSLVVSVLGTLISAAPQTESSIENSIYNNKILNNIHRIYPNIFPAGSEPTMALSQFLGEIKQIEILTLSGQIVSKINKPGSNIILPSLGPGIYFTNIYVSDKKYVEKFIVY